MVFMARFGVYAFVLCIAPEQYSYLFVCKYSKGLCWKSNIVFVFFKIAIVTKYQNT